MPVTASNDRDETSSDPSLPKKRQSTTPLTMEQARIQLAKGITDPTWSKALHQFMFPDARKATESATSPHVDIDVDSDNDDDDDDIFGKLALFLEQEKQAGQVIFPPQRQEIFAALNACPMDQVRVVILGQDPYHGAGQAHGLAFSVRRGVRIPPSLRNILQELQDEGLVFLQDSTRRQHGNLEHWAKQGVLLLNTVLTVREGEAHSHAKQGWEEFTNAVIEALLTLHSNADDSENRRLVFLLWGNPAAEKISNCAIDPKQHVIIRTSHPSPLSARRTKAPFLGSNCFRQANEALIESGYDPIDW
eukprot:CAMPEP_0172448670 /NCGR_PEP_ID=MMETSP1065-20121228/7635_1 /TAXON_ID=265537 /ORGANISM="Amphiprora paludosa, Strain CCMP125" /LENGTH=304 /DNA_ID=CAMNT_0013200227 /DNA_START=37 /DNA_END=948 /DNA_ORIENTATION=+